MEKNLYGVVLRLRHLANEFNEAKRIPLKELFPIKHRLLRQANNCVNEAWELGALRSLQEFRQLQEAWESYERNAKEVLLADHGFFECVERNEDREFAARQVSLIWPGSKVVYSDGPTTFTMFPYTNFELLVGFSMVLAFCKETWACRSSGDEVWEGQIEQCSYVLKSGILSKVGLVPEMVIYLGWDSFDEKLGEYEIRNGSHQHSFEALGHYAAGCRVIADIIEDETKQTVAPEIQPKQVGGLIDGLDRSKLEFVWCGERYEWLTETMMDALEVLHKAHRDDRKVWPDEMANKIGDLPIGGFFKVFEVARAGWDKVHPVRKIVGGRANSGWYLIKQNSLQT